MFKICLMARKANLSFILCWRVLIFRTMIAYDVKITMKIQVINMTWACITLWPF